MVHLLIVDDEDLTVKRLQSSIQWESLGISQVFSAFSMGQAQKLFREQQIDIMLCDIEMPAGSGLELLQWVREQGYQTINIFLTGHANFAYAKEALSLETMEYILKPVSFSEIRRVVGKAVAQLKERRSEKGEQRTSFFLQLVQGEILPMHDSILRAGQRLHAGISTEDTCLPVIIASKENFLKQGEDSYWDTKPAVLNIAADCFPQLLCRPLRLARQILLLFPGDTHRDLLSQDLCSFLNTASATLSVDLLLCGGRTVSLEELRAEVLMLLHTEQDIVKTSGVLFFPFQRKTSLSGRKPDYPLWAILLGQGEPQGVTIHVREYLEACPQLDHDSLSRFYQHYLQMLGGVLAQKQIPAQKLESFFLADAPHSLSQLMRWVENVNTQACSLLGGKEDTTVAERAKAYVDSHILGEISRNQVAESIHVSPEYLSRVFRQVTGYSLVEYITKAKMNAAQEMLTHSGQPISQIASQLGYGNFSYFSQLFRSYFSLSPSEFRRRNQTRLPD